MKRFALILALAVPLLGQAKADDKPVTISGYVFGDYYSVVSHHDPEHDGKNGFWIRRGYLSFDRTFRDGLSARVRFEINQPGDFETNAITEPYVKDAYVKWKRSPRLELVLGLSPTPGLETIEKVWGYRPVERTPLDLHRLVASRDLGIAVAGTFGSRNRYRYHVQGGNGANTGSETNREKRLAASFTVEPTSATLVELYADHDSRPGDDDRSTLQLFAALQRPGHRFGIQLARQIRDSGDIDVASLFAVADVRKHVALLARIDRLFDPSPEGDRIAFLPFDTTSRSTLLILGVDYKAHPNLSIIPNVEYVRYDDGPEDDILPRLTVHFTF